MKTFTLLALTGTAAAFAPASQQVRMPWCNEDAASQKLGASILKRVGKINIVSFRRSVRCIFRIPFE